MRKLGKMCAVVLLFACTNSISFSDIMIDVHASSAPNAYGSPSWSGYMSNALYALENGLSVYGDRLTDPTAYERAPGTVGPGEIAVTSFNSWRGKVNPLTPFNNEHGNRMHFGLHVVGDGLEQFMLNDLTFEIHSSDPGDSLVFVGDFIGYNYNGTSRYGIDWGADRAKGGGDDIVYNSGNGTTLVDELVYVGVGNAWWPGGADPDPSNPIGGPQAAMDDYFAWVGSEAPILVTTTYSIGSYSGSDCVSVVPVPAAVLLGMFGLGAAGMKLRKFA